MNLYVYNNQKVILFSKDQNLLFKQFNQKLLQIQSESSLTTSNYYSTTLKWTFVLQTTFRIPWQYTSELLAFLIFLSLILLLGLVIISLMVRRFSIPMKKILINYNDGIWRDYLTGVSTDRDSIVQQLKNEDIHPGTGFTILLIQDIRSGGNCGTSLLKNVSLTLAQLDFVQQSNIIHQKNIICKAHIVAIENSLTAVALIVENVYPFDDCHRLISDITKKITEGLESDDRESIYIGVGQFKDNIALIPISYREAREALNYKIVTNAHIITYPSVMERSAYYEYPYDIEKQLVNNILTGDVASSEKYIDQFFAKLAGPDLSIQDNEIKAIIYQLETAIFRGISSLPIPVKLDTGFNLPDMPDMQSVRQLSLIHI